MSSFIPEQPKAAIEVPFFEDARSEAGWQGQTTTKSIELLKSEISLAVGRLGGIVTGFQKGKFQVGSRERVGFRLTYNIETNEGKMIPGRIDIAALPVRNLPSSSFDARCEKSLKMALFMLRDAFDGLWFLQQLSPGFAPLMPFMLSGKGDLTVSQLWFETQQTNLLTAGESEFIDGEVKEIHEEK